MPGQEVWISQWKGLVRHLWDEVLYSDVKVVINTNYSSQKVVIVSYYSVEKIEIMMVLGARQVGKTYALDEF